jgi:hypothetical protein
VVHLSMEPGLSELSGAQGTWQRHPSNLAVAGPTITVCPTVLAQRPKQTLWAEAFLCLCACRWRTVNRAEPLLLKAGRALPSRQ